MKQAIVKSHLKMDIGCGWACKINGRHSAISANTSNDIAGAEIEMLKNAIKCVAEGESMMIITDSKYIMNVVNSWIYEWSRTDFSSRRVHADEWRELFKEMTKRRVQAHLTTKNRKGSAIHQLKSEILECINEAVEAEIEVKE